MSSDEPNEEEIRQLWKEHREEALAHFRKGTSFNVRPEIPIGLPISEWPGKEEFSQSIRSIQFVHETWRVPTGKHWRIRSWNVIVEEGFDPERLP